MIIGRSGVGMPLESGRAAAADAGAAAGPGTPGGGAPAPLSRRGARLPGGGPAGVHRCAQVCQLTGKPSPSADRKPDSASTGIGGRVQGAGRGGVPVSGWG